MKNPSDAKDNNRFQNTHTFPVSLSETFDGTTEIPYAPDLRPALPIEPTRKRKAAKRPKISSQNAFSGSKTQSAGVLDHIRNDRQMSDEPCETDTAQTEMNGNVDQTDEMIEDQLPQICFDAPTDPEANHTINTDIPADSEEPQNDDWHIQFEVEPTVPPSHRHDYYDLDEKPFDKSVQYDQTSATLPKEAIEQPVTDDPNIGQEKTRSKSHQKRKSFLFWFPVLIGIILMLGFLYVFFPKFQSMFREPISSGEISSMTISSEEILSSEKNTSGKEVSFSSDNEAPSISVSDYSNGDISLERTIFSNALSSSSGAVSSDTESIFIIQIEQPQVNLPANPAAGKKINATLTMIYKKLVEDARRMSEEYADNRALSDTPQEEELPGSYRSFCQLLQEDEKIITIMDNADIYNGGATNFQTVHCYHFRIDNGEQILLENWIRDRSAIADLIIDTIQSDEALLSLVHKSVYEKYISDHICDEWYLSGDSVVFLYQQYNIGPGASGTIEIVLPLDRCQSFFAF